MLLGLTGGYCAGKNVVAAMLEKRGFLCFDLDKLGHQVLEDPEVILSLTKHFGNKILNERGGLDRKSLGAIVFSDPEALAWQESVVHPAVYRILLPRMEAALSEGRDVCLNAALLYRMSETSRCDAVLEVRAPLYVRVRRGRVRDGLSARAILDRVRNQRSFWDLRSNFTVPVLFLRNAKDEAALEAALDRTLLRVRGISEHGSAKHSNGSRR